MNLCLFFGEGKVMILILYVDDLIFTGSHSWKIIAIKDGLKKEFKMIDLGQFHYFLGIEVFSMDLSLSRKVLP